MIIRKGYEASARANAMLIKGAMTFFALPAILSTVVTSVAQAQDVDPSAPLDVLKTARDTAQNSNMNVEDVTTTGTNVLNIILIIFGVLGVALAGISTYKLYSNIQQGEQARGSNMSYIVGLIVGSMLTILAIIVGLVTTYATGSGG